MKLLVCGGRDYTHYDIMKEELSFICFMHDVTEVIHGGARGADMLGDRFAKERGLNVTSFKAQWDKDGKRTGYIRNQIMLEVGQPDIAAVFPGGKGTNHMYQLIDNEFWRGRIIEYDFRTNGLPENRLSADLIAKWKGITGRHTWPAVANVLRKSDVVGSRPAEIVEEQYELLRLALKYHALKERVM
jgi:hypothetical protein